ncbi:MAG: DUF370 domain-containing protein [Chloroflexota bacterium]|nr:DUF370 domain-containing protein [Chloroflexota bacterium]
MNAKQNHVQTKNRFPYLWPLGQAGMAAPDRVIAVGDWEDKAIRQAVVRARDRDCLIDLTGGRACLWVVFLDSGHLVLATKPMPVASIDLEDYAWDEDPRAEALW